MMASRIRFCLSVTASAAVVLLASSPAAAQWLWKDDNGRVVASDLPPPTDVPQSRILKEPRSGRVASTPAPEKSAPPDASKAVADHELESKLRQKEAAEAAKKASDDAATAKAMQENCNAVRGNLAALQSGGRAARFNEKGERVYIDDAQRQSEIARAQGQVAQFCK